MWRKIINNTAQQSLIKSDSNPLDLELWHQHEKYYLESLQDTDANI